MFLDKIINFININDYAEASYRYELIKKFTRKYDQSPYPIFSHQGIQNSSVKGELSPGKKYAFYKKIFSTIFCLKFCCLHFVVFYSYMLKDDPFSAI